MPKKISLCPKRIDHVEEVLVLDERDSLGPAEMVQRRLNELHGEVPGMRGRAMTAMTGRRPERSA